MRKTVLILFILVILSLVGCSTLKQTTFECVKPCHASIGSTDDPSCFKQTIGDSQLCTLEYRWEDKCLDYFTCQKTDNGCNAVSQGYETCINCVKKCLETNDFSERQECTSQC